MIATVFLIAYSCASSLMLDCTYSVEEVWTGDRAYQDCVDYVPTFIATNRALTPYSRVFCEEQ